MPFTVRPCVKPETNRFVSFVFKPTTTDKGRLMAPLASSSEGFPGKAIPSIAGAHDVEIKQTLGLAQLTPCAWMMVAASVASRHKRIDLKPRPEQLQAVAIVWVFFSHATGPCAARVPD